MSSITKKLFDLTYPHTSLFSGKWHVLSTEIILKMRFPGPTIEQLFLDRSAKTVFLEPHWAGVALKVNSKGRGFFFVYAEAAK